MNEQMIRSNLNVFNPTVENSGTGETLINFNTGSQPSDIMGTDTTSDFVTVNETLQGLLKDSLSNREEVIEDIEVVDVIIGINPDHPFDPLVFTDTEKGILDDSDRVYEKGYSDEYQLKGFGDNETVTLNLDGLGFSSSLELINGETGEILHQYEVMETEGTSHNQLSFTTDNNIDYVVRVSAIEKKTTGEYILKTTSGELTENLVFSDTETGVLDSTDQTYQGRYRDEYILRGVEDKETVILNLDSVGFGGSLQLVNRETGAVIHQSQITESEENAPLQLTFSSNKDIEYLVRVTSTGDTDTGSYTLGTTLGELTLGISDQTIQGSITLDDGTVDVWDRSNTDVYEITNLSHFQTINITLDSFEQPTMLLLINADTGQRLTSRIGFYDREAGYFSAKLNYTPRHDNNINYAVVASFYESDRVGHYTLNIDTSFSLSGGFNSDHEATHPIIRNRFMDNFVISDLQVGQDVELNLDSNSSGNLVQLFDQKTGNILQTTTESNLEFTVEEGINYGVRILGEAGDTYNLTTNTGILFDSNPTKLNQTISNSVSTSDATAYFKDFGSNLVYYSDGYYVSGDSLRGEDEVTISIENWTWKCLPDLQIINPQTGEILGSYGRYNFRTKTLSYDLTVEEGVDYLFLVTSRYSGQLGDYDFTVKSVTE